DLARVHIQTVHDLPQRREGLERVPLGERGQFVPRCLQHPRQLPIDVHQHALGFGEVFVHEVLHLVLHVWLLRSPSVPIAIRSSSIRFAFSSNRGSVPVSACLTPNRRPSCASASFLPTSPMIR